MAKEKEETKQQEPNPASAKEARGEANGFKPSPSGESMGITGHELFGKSRSTGVEVKSKDYGITGRELIDRLRARSEAR